MIEHSPGASTRRPLLRRAAGLALAASLLCAGQALAQDAALVAAAKKEGKASLYAVTDPNIIQAFTTRFKEKYGIDIEVTRLISGALGKRLSAEQDSGSPVADVVLDTDKNLQEALAAKGMFAPIETVPGINAYPTSVRTAHVVVIAHVPYSLVWNTSLVKDPPKGWADLVDPRWKGRLMVIDPRVGGSPALWHVLMRETYGDAFLRSLGQNGTLSPSAVPGHQQIAAGAKSVYAPGIHQIVVGLRAKGAPIGEIFPQPTIASDTGMMVMARAPHPSVARLLASFALSVEGQAILNKDGFSPIQGVPGTLPLPKLAVPDFRSVREKIPSIMSLLGVQ